MMLYGSYRNLGDPASSTHWIKRDLPLATVNTHSNSERG